MKIVFALGTLLATAALASAGNWPGWRGEAQNGASSSSVPASFSESQNLLWKTALPGRGCSTPIVWGKRIFLTTEIDGQDGVLAYDFKGRELWRATIGELTPGRGKRVGSGANSSPVTDGKRLFVYFKSGNFAAFSLEGKQLWKVDLTEIYGEDTLWWDKGSSPVIAAGNVVAPIMQTEGDSYLISLDPKTGKEVWSAKRNYETAPESGDAYTTPQVLEIDGVETIVTWGANHLTGHDARNGKLLWEVDGFNPDNAQYWRVIASSVVDDNIALVPYNRGDAVAAIDLNASGKYKKWLWKNESLGSDSATPVARDGKAYILKDSKITRGRVTCVDLKSGDTIWESTLPRSAKIYYASPIIAGDTFIAAREDGTVFTAKIGPNGLSNIVENPLLETIIASPVAIDNKLLLRSDQHLYCFAE